jgi:hypothetical protein
LKLSQNTSAPAREHTAPVAGRQAAMSALLALGIGMGLVLGQVQPRPGAGADGADRWPCPRSPTCPTG